VSVGTHSTGTPVDVRIMTRAELALRGVRSPVPLRRPDGAGPSDDGHVWVGGFTARMNPDGSNVEIIGFNYRNSYEQTVNSLGDIYQSDNDDPPASEGPT